MSCDYVGELVVDDLDGAHRTSVYACWECPGRPLVLDATAHQHAHHPTSAPDQPAPHRRET